jgi:hypothetical protein
MIIKFIDRNHAFYWGRRVGDDQESNNLLSQSGGRGIIFVRGRNTDWRFKKNKDMYNICGPKRENVTKDCIKLYNEDLPNLYSSNVPCD